MKNDYLSKTGFKCGTLVQDVFQYGEMGDAKWTLGTARNNQGPPTSYCSTKPIDYLK